MGTLSALDRGIFPQQFGPDRPMVGAFTYRGNVVENTHLVHVVVVDSRGDLTHSFGDPYRTTLIRSSFKPIQALAIIETGALEHFNLDQEELALICASHNSEPRHIEVARSILAKSSSLESDLQCGGHVPANSVKVTNDWIREGVVPTGIHNNCSGKHAGMLASTQAMNVTSTGYQLQHHPLQVRVMRAMADVADLSEEQVQWSIDGCNLPTPAIPLDRLARVYAKLASAKSSDETSSREASLYRIYQAMTSHPEMVAGDDRFCTILMRAFQGNVVGKVGADACYGIGVREPPIGISVKIEDGNLSVLYCAVVDVLDQLKIGTQAQRDKLSAFRNPLIRNSMGIVTGQMRATAVLQRPNVMSKKLSNGV